MTTKQSSPLSNRECMKLMESWGFKKEKRNGGHLVMIRDGKRVQISAPSRRMPTPYKALSQAAVISGVDLTTFLHGPTRARTQAPSASEIRVQQPCGCVIDEHGFEPCPEHQTKEEVVAVVEVSEVEIPRRKRIRKVGETPIAEVSWKRSNNALAAVRSFGIEEADFDIEVFEDENDDQDDAVIEEVTPVRARKPRSTEKQTRTTRVVKPVAALTVREQAEAMFTNVFPGPLVVDDAVEDARALWVAATATLIRSLESASTK